MKLLPLTIIILLFILTIPLTLAHSGNTELEEKDHEEIKVSDYGVLGKGYRGWLTLLTILIIVVFALAWFLKDN
jgi:PhoPQ-activated pathogenicity-related protein